MSTIRILLILFVQEAYFRTMVNFDGLEGEKLVRPQISAVALTHCPNMRLIVLASSWLAIAFCQNAADLEFSPYVYTAVNIPFKSSNYAKDWFGSDVALVQHPLLAPAKPSKPGNPVALPTIAPYVVSWKDLDNTHINDENVWNFEKRVDSKVWWPS